MGDHLAVHNIILTAKGQKKLEVPKASRKRKEITSNREEEHFSIVKDIFEKDIDDWRNEESFQGNSTQLQYIRDILLCDSAIIRDDENS